MATRDEADRNGEDDIQEVAKIPRADTGIRVLLMILFAVVAGVLRTVITVIVIFELVWALITQSAPSVRVREFANRVIAYYYRLHRYLTYNEATVPFPFSPVPPALEPTGSPHEESDTDVRDLLR